MSKYVSLANAQAPFYVRRETLRRHWNTDAIIGSEYDDINEAETYEAAAAALNCIDRFDDDGCPLDDETNYTIVDTHGHTVARPAPAWRGVDNDDGVPF